MKNGQVQEIQDRYIRPLCAYHANSAVVHLTQVSKKGKEHKVKLFEQVQEAANQYQQVWLFRVENMRNLFIKQVRLDFASSKIFVGRNKVMAKALGKDANEELLEGIHELSGKLSGDIGLLFTNEPEETVKEYMENLCELDYARAGCVAAETITVTADQFPLKNVQTDENIPATAESQLRACGLPTTLIGGHIKLNKESHTVCEKGEKLKSEQCRLLKLLGHKLSHFRIHLVGCYTDGKYTEY